MSNTKEAETLEQDSSMAMLLIENGFLKFADQSDIIELSNQLQNAFDIYDERNFRMVHIDAEALTEFNFDFFLPALNRMLSKRGIGLTIEKANDDPESYEVVVNGEVMQLYTSEELDSGVYLESGPGNFFRRINEILESNQVEERFYLLYSGNDLHAFLLTNELHSIIADSYAEEPTEIPHLP